jgi:hypothetical protein
MAAHQSQITLIALMMPFGVLTRIRSCFCDCEEKAESKWDFASRNVPYHIAFLREGPRFGKTP